MSNCMNYKYNIMKLILFAWCIFLALLSSAQTIIKPYGGYIQVQREPGERLKSNFDVFVYFPANTTIPDSLILDIDVAPRGEQLILCNNIIRQTYTFSNVDLFHNEYYYVYSFFQNNIESRFIGKNCDSLKIYNKLQFSLLGGLRTTPITNYSSIFKDFPLVKVEKGNIINLNLFDYEPDGDIMWPFKLRDISNDPSSTTPKGVFLNAMTADMSIDTKNIDTGYYTFVIELTELDYNDKSTTWYNFTIYVVNEHIPYFTNSNIQIKDSLNIPFIKASVSDKVINYQTDYVVPKGLENFEVAMQSPLIFNKKPEITGLKINDTTLRVNLKIFMDRGTYKKVYEKLPQSISIIVTRPDSGDNCSQDMTSFYITRDPLTSDQQIEENTLQNVKIYPNPASDKLHIDLNKTVFNNFNIKIFDCIGNLLKTSEFKPKENLEIDISELNPGMYFIEMITDNKNSVSKFVKE